MEVSIYFEFWTLKMECTQYGLYGQAALKNASAILIFKVGRSGQQFSVGIWKFWIDFVGLPGGARSRAPAPIHLPWKFIGGGLVSAMV